MNLYAKYIEPVADTFAYCLLRNHFHLSVRIKSEEEILETLLECDCLHPPEPAETQVCPGFPRVEMVFL
jgi:hypothetical protein